MQNNNKTKWDYRKEIKKTLQSGTLLLSEPFMLDPSFIRSACLMVNHIKDEGSFGFVLNKKTNNKLHDLIDIDADIEFDIYYGGPVGVDSLFFIHDNSFQLSGAQPINKQLYWNGNFEELRMKIEAGIISKNSIRFFVGYSGWDKGQLRKEIIENSWILYNDNNFSIDQIKDNLWKNVLTKMGGIYTEFTHYPVDPNLN